MGRLLLGVLAGLVLGVGVGFALFSVQLAQRGIAPLTPTPSGDAAQTAARSGAPLLETPGERGSGETRESARPEPAEPYAPVSDSRLKAALARADAPPVETRRGAGELWGEVTDLDGVGVEGVVVRAQASRPGVGLRNTQAVGQGPPEMSLEKTVREAAQRFAENRAGLFRSSSMHT